MAIAQHLAAGQSRGIGLQSTDGEKMMPGFGELMRQTSLQQVPTAILSRQTAGIRGQTLVVNLPGRPASIRTCLAAIFPAIPYCLDLIGSPGLDTHADRCKAFRPPA
jgi:molybdopterin adenylyltransferase